MKHVIHVHQHKLRAGAAALIDRTWRGSTHHRTIHILCPDCGTPAATVVQSDVPDRCGARAWIEATATKPDTPSDRINPNA